MISRVTRVVRRGIIPKLRAPRPGKDYGGAPRAGFRASQLESRNSCEQGNNVNSSPMPDRRVWINRESERFSANQWKGKRGEEKGKRKKKKIDPLLLAEITAIIARVRCFLVAEEHHLNHEWFINFTPGSQRSGGPRATRPEEPN